jgi:hypothetical protein
MFKKRANTLIWGETKKAADATLFITYLTAKVYSEKFTNTQLQRAVTGFFVYAFTVFEAGFHPRQFRG